MENDIDKEQIFNDANSALSKNAAVLGYIQLAQSDPENAHGYLAEAAKIAHETDTCVKAICRNTISQKWIDFMKLLGQPKN